jgi:predicted restriction endonuclease
MGSKRLWSRDELIIAMNLYCKLTFGQFHKRNPIIIEVAQKLGRTPSSLTMKLCNLASFDPAQQARGITGLRGASKADKEIWDEFINNWEKLGIKSEEKFQELFASPISTRETQSEKLTTINKPKGETEGEATVKVRKGQDFFRETIMAAYGNRCCITGNPVPELLIASHILPWSKYPEHRLNPHNGLCLARTHDVAFDRGLITFDENYTIVISTYLEKFLPEETLEFNFFAYRGKQINLPEKFLPNPDFLRYHREEIFRN